LKKKIVDKFSGNKKSGDPLMFKQFIQAFCRGGLAAIILAVGAVFIAARWYLPARAARKNLEQELIAAEARQTEKRRLADALRQQAEEIENGDPETVTEAMRRQLRKGTANEFAKEINN
jgi:hypothetical protein